MKLLMLEIENFRSFKEKQIFQFQGSGLYFLQGDNQKEPRLGANGAGKSTIWDALCWLIWGKTLRGLKAGEVANWEIGSKVSVRLRYEYEGLVYCVTRTWKPNSWVMLAPATGPIDLVEDETNLLWYHLRLSYLAATHSIFMAQQQPMFLDISPKDKATLFSEVMDLDKWLEYSDRASRQTSNLARHATELERDLAKIEGSLVGLREVDFQKEVDAWEKQNELKLNRFEIEYSDDAARAKAKKQDLKLMSAKLKEILTRYDAVDTTAKTCSSCGQKITNKEHVKLSSEVQDCEFAIRKTSVYLKQLENNLDYIEREVDALSHATNPFLNRQNDTQSKIEVLENERSKLESKVDEVREKQRLAEFWIQGFKDLRLRLIADSLEQLEIETNSCLIELGLVNWKLRFSVDRENKSGNLTRGFSVKVESPDNDQLVPWEVWSGGESQRLRLATTMGLSNLIRNVTGATINLECWDEPSNYLNAGGITELLDSMRNRADDENRQIWIVDHRSLGYAEFDKCVTIVKNDTGSVIMEG